jgi:hypothetical protein
LESILFLQRHFFGAKLLCLEKMLFNVLKDCTSFKTVLEIGISLLVVK